MNSRLKVLLVASSSTLVLLILFGSVLGRSAGPEGPYRQLAVYTEVLSRIKSEYVEEPDLKSVTLGAVNGMLESLDPFASYLNADQFKEYQKNKDAGKAQTGLLLSKRFGYVGVVGVLPGSPAAKAGLVTGDMLETIKGVATRDMPLAYAEMLMHGEAGSTIDVSILRVRKPEPQKLSLQRAVLQPIPVTSKLLPEQIAYVRVETLTGGKVPETAAAFDGMQKQGAKRAVLDLRSCAAGDPEQGIALANLFIEKGTLATLQGQKMAKKSFDAEAAKARYKALPLSVIVNRGTAAGCEVAAAALLDSKRAELVGERTYGDAAVRKAVTMDDGGAVILSVAKYFGPAGKSIQDNGVMPGALMQEAEAAANPDEDGDGEPDKNDKGETTAKPAEDLLLKKAIEVVSKK